MNDRVFRLYINTENDAFQGDDCGRFETARILREVADRVEAGDIQDLYRTIYDKNGNDCGRAAFKRDA